MSAPPILIAGAGIGGLTAALALARRGFAVTVAERRTGFSESGAGVQLSPNAGRVLDGLDLRLPLKRAGVVASRLCVRRWHDGATLAAMPMSAGDGQTPFRLIRRADLHLILLDAARAMPNIRLVVGRGVADAVQDRDGVAVTLRGETSPPETLRALALIGADGLWSSVRALAGAAGAPAFTGFEAWRALVPVTGATPEAEVTLHLGQGRHAVHYPVAGGREINLVIVRAAREAREGWSREGERGLMAGQIAGANPSLHRLAVSAGDWRVWSLFDRPPAAMSHGAIALLGDAAHPVLPFMAQGAALAIEDAAVLAARLSEAVEARGPAGVPGALAAYAAARASRVARVQATSRGNGRAYHLGRPWSLARDMVMKRLGPDGLRRRHDWLYGWHAPA